MALIDRLAARRHKHVQEVPAVAGLHEIQIRIYTQHPDADWDVKERVAKALIGLENGLKDGKISEPEYGKEKERLLKEVADSDRAGREETVKYVMRVIDAEISRAQQPAPAADRK